MSSSAPFKDIQSSGDALALFKHEISSFFFFTVFGSLYPDSDSFSGSVSTNPFESVSSSDSNGKHLFQGTWEVFRKLTPVHLYKLHQDPKFSPRSFFANPDSNF